MAVDLLAEERPGHELRIHIVDSHTYSFIYGWPVCEAARLLRNGAELEYVMDMLNDRFSRAEVVLSAFSLKVMKKSGRVSAAAAFAGELLGLRPIISLIDGKSKVEAKVRGDAAVPGALIKYVRSRVDNIDEDFEYMIACTDIPAVDDLIKQCKKEFATAPCMCSSWRRCGQQHRPGHHCHHLSGPSPPLIFPIRKLRHPESNRFRGAFLLTGKISVADRRQNLL